jgi:uncharacterized membrane protein
MHQLIVKQRIQSLDILKGGVMIIMALDHVRHLSHIDYIRGEDPLNFATTTPFLFFTRWITNYCAPVFIFLSGSSVFFMSRTKSKKELGRFLLTRGLWLIFLELTVLHFGWESEFYYYRLNLQVIWVIGLSMIFLSALIFLPSRVQLIAGLLLVFGHNLPDRFTITGSSAMDIIWSLLHVRHVFAIDKLHSVSVSYPLIPWVGVMLLGFRFGTFYKKDFPQGKRKSILLKMGIACVLLFCVLRTGNFYGDSFHWEKQNSAIFTILSFVNTTKYPPSLLYLLITLGPAFIFLSLAENLRNKIFGAVSIFGRVPMFYYILHVYLIHFFVWVLFFLYGHSWIEIDFARRQSGYPDGFGLSIFGVYVLWIISVFALYFACKQYNNYKSRHSYWWLSYL